MFLVAESANADRPPPRFLHSISIRLLIDGKYAGLALGVAREAWEKLMYGGSNVHYFLKRNRYIPVIRLWWIHVYDAIS
jgi:hypothetical protein